MPQPRATEAANRIGPVCDQMIITVEQRKLQIPHKGPQGDGVTQGDALLLVLVMSW